MSSWLKDQVNYLASLGYAGIGTLYARKYIKSDDIYYGVGSIHFLERSVSLYPDSYWDKDGLERCLNKMKSYVDYQMKNNG